MAIIFFTIMGNEENLNNKEDLKIQITDKSKEDLRNKDNPKIEDNAKLKMTSLI